MVDVLLVRMNILVSFVLEVAATMVPRLVRHSSLMLTFCRSFVEISIAQKLALNFQCTTSFFVFWTGSRVMWVARSSSCVSEKAPRASAIKSQRTSSGDAGTTRFLL